MSVGGGGAFRERDGAADDPPPAPRPLRDRVIFRIDGKRGGPVVVICGAMHGNEPAGVTALERVHADVLELGLDVRGTVVGVIGNRAAFERGNRFMARDLNRQWFPEHLQSLREADRETLEAEDREQLELLEMFDELERQSAEPIIVLDLHTTSGPGAPFSCMADVIRNRDIAFCLPVPVVLGLEEIIEGAMLGYLCDQGHVGIAVEGGQHRAPETITNLVAAIWITLVSTGVLARESVPRYAEHVASLAAITRGLPEVLEIRHRHVCHDGDGFEMGEGYRNFQPVAEGQVVAVDDEGDIAVPEAGIMMMPRYQGQGEDGYFLAREVNGVWLEMSRLLRRARVDRLVGYLPGVRAHPEREDHYILDPKIARFKPIEILHLFGYRRKRKRREGLVFSRRRPDFVGTREDGER